jgi:hypothetical protein
MNESGATAFEVRQLARSVGSEGLSTFMNFPTYYRVAILEEALNFLADHKERAAIAGPGAGEG